MIIRKIELTNWGPHRSLVADLTANVVGVIGGNGKGKSNFLQAIDYGLSGNLNKQNKELYIYNFGKEDGATKATVRIEFSKNGMDGEITRTISKSATTRCLKWDGKVYKSDAEVSAQMSRILGADKAAMANAVFIKQGCLAALVKGTPADRMAIFQKLMNLSFLDSRYNDLHNRIDRLKAGVTDYRPALDIVASQLASAKEKYDSLKSTLPEDRSEDLRLVKEVTTLKAKQDSARANVASTRGKLLTAQTTYRNVLAGFDLTPDDDISESLREAEKALNECVTCLNTKEDIRRVRETSSGLISRRDTESCRLVELKRDLLSDSELAAATERLQTVKERIKTKEQASAISKKLEDAILVRSTAQTATEEASEKAKAAELAYVSSYESLSIIAESKRNDVHTLALRKAYWEGDCFSDVCPVCGSGVEAIDEEKRIKLLEYIDVVLREAKEVAAKADAKCEALVNDRSRTKTELEVWKTRLAAAEDTVNTIEADLKALEVCDTSMEDLTAEHATLVDKINTHNKCAVAVAGSTETIRSLDTQIADNSARLIELKSTLGQKEYTEAELASLKSNYERWKIICSNVTTAIANVKAIQDLLNTFIQEEVVATADLEESYAAESIVNAFSLESISEDALARLTESLETEMDKYRTAEAAMDNLQSTMLQLVEERQRILEKIEIEKERLQLIDDLETVAKMTNKNGLPLAYMNSVFDHITGMVQDMLSRMGANFTVLKDEERPCTFRFIRTDDTTGYSMPQEMLSGGQAIRLSLALLIACQQLILPEVGLLVLDEPSSHMDAEGVDSLKELFLQMTSIFHSSETQLITVDHNPSLVAALEKVIQL